MVNRSGLLGAIAAAALASICLCPAHGDPAAAGQQDTWTGVERIVAVGDVHGDYAQFLKVLKAAGVIDDKEAWIAGKTHLVQTGDVVDKGAASRKCMDLLMKLEKQAADAGGAVHALIGNHEVMVLMDDCRFTTKGEIDAFGGKKGYAQAMSAQGKYGQWIRSHNAVIKINEVLFLHAGLTSSYTGKSLAEINKAIRDELAKGERNGVAADPDGPLWDRTLALDNEGLVAKDLDKVLKAFDARHMVIGHTADTDGVLTRAADRLIRIDVGMTGMYRGPAACLLIEKGAYSEVRHGTEKPIIKKLFADLATSRPATTQPATEPATRPAATAAAHYAKAA